MNPSLHPSFLALDSFALGDDAPEVATHVVACPDCRAHVESVRVVEPVPAWALACAPKRRVWGSLRWATAAMALATVVIVSVVFYPSEPELPKIIAKAGAPTVGVYIKRGDRVLLWDGSRAIQPGDKLRLKVMAAGYSYVSVLGTDDGGVPVRLYTGAVDGDGLVLPVAWEVDAAPGAERLTVVLSYEALSVTEAWSRVQAAPSTHPRRTDDAWIIPLVLPKHDGGRTL